MPKIGRPTTFAGDWRRLADHAGGVTALAKKFGVSPSTIRRWAHGETEMIPVFRPILDALKKELDAGSKPRKTKKRSNASGR